MECFSATINVILLGLILLQKNICPFVMQYYNRVVIIKVIKKSTLLINIEKLQLPPFYDNPLILKENSRIK